MNEYIDKNKLGEAEEPEVEEKEVEPETELKEAGIECVKVRDIEISSSTIRANILCGLMDWILTQGSVKAYLNILVDKTKKKVESYTG